MAIKLKIRHLQMKLGLVACLCVCEGGEGRGGEWSRGTIRDANSTPSLLVD